MKKLLLSLLLILSYLSAFAQPQGNRGLFFDGVDDQVVLANPIALNDFTIEFWLKTKDTRGIVGNWYDGLGLVDADASGSNPDYGVSLAAGKIKFGIAGGITYSEYTLTSNASVNDGAWHHIAVTRNDLSGLMEIYIDGVLDIAQIGSVLSQTLGTVPISIGRVASAPSTPNFYFNGEIDEVKVFNSVRNSAEIALDMNSVATNTFGLVGYWNFEQGTGQTVSDVQTNTTQNNGTLGTNISPESADPFWALRVKNTLDSGLESLRDVITNANTLAGINYIDFSIGVGTQNISIISNLPTISDAVILDGTSKEDYAFFSQMIQIDNGASVINGLVFSGTNASNSIVRGLQITNFRQPATTGQGISISNANNIQIIDNLISNNFRNINIATANATVIKGNRIGTNLSGNAAFGTDNLTGISLNTNVTNTIIGGAGVGEGNLISGHTLGGTHNGIRIQGGNNSVIYGNLIGVNASRTAFIPNSTGIAIADGQNNTIGGLAAGQANIIAGNGSGITYTGGVVVGNTYIGNQIYCNTTNQMTLSIGNNNQAPPVITLANSSGNVSGTGVTGDIIHLYKNPSGACNASSIQQYLGNATVTGGIWSMSGLSLSAGDVIVGTQTNASNGSSGYSVAFTIIINTFFTLGDTNWSSNANWSSDGSTLCGCRPQGVTGATITIRSGHIATLSNNADLGTNNTINIQDPLSTLEVTASISTPIQTLNGQAGTRILMRVFTFPTITTNNFASTAGTTVEFGANTAGTIPNQFNGNNYKSLVISGSGGAKNAGGNILVQEDFFLLGGDVFHVGGGDFTVDGITTIAPSSMFIDNATSGINTFNGVINNDGVLSAIGAGGNVSTFNFNNDIINSPTGTLNLDCNCQYNFNKAVAPPLLLQSGLAMIFGSNGGGSGNIFSDLTIGDGALVTFNVTNATQLLIANDKVVNNNNSTNGVMLNGNGSITGANANSRWVQGNSAQLYYNSDVPMMNTGILDASTNPNTVFYSRAGDQVIQGITYHSVAFGGSGLRNVTTGNFTINTNLTVPSGITFQINGNNFTANGVVTIVGTFNDTATPGTNTFNGAVQVTGTMTTAVSTNTTFIFRGNIINQGTFNLQSSTQWTLDADLTIQNQSANPMHFAQANSGVGQINGNIIILDSPGGGDIFLHTNSGNDISGTGTLTNQLGSGTVVGRRLILEICSVPVTNENNALIEYRAGIDIPTKNTSAPNNFFIYALSVATINANTFHHVHFTNTASSTLAGNLIINGDLVTSNTHSLNANTFNINIKGSWLTNGAFVAGTGNVVFDGTNVQNITTNGSSPFNTININNNNNVSLNTVAQTNSITLTQGRLVLNNNDFTLAATPATNQITQSFTNASTSYVETNGIGRLIRNGLQIGTTYIFPIGETTSIRYISVTPTTAGNMAAKLDTPLIPLPPLSFTDVAVGSWSLSGLEGSVTFFNSGCTSTNSKVYRLNGAVWDITGITTTVALPSYTATALNFTASERYTIFGTAPLVINPLTLLNGQVSIAYSQTPFSVVAGLPPFTFSLSNGTLPAGLSLTGDQLTGIPTIAGSYTFTIKALDNAGNIGERTYTLIIDKGEQFVQSYSSVLLPDGKYELSATFDSGLPASFISTNKDVATIQGNILTLTSQIFDGETNILAFQAGDGNFKASDSVVVLRINNFGLTTGLNDLEKNTKIYPNPATEKVSVATTKNSIEIQNVELLTLTGYSVIHQAEKMTQNDITIPLKNIPTGVYLLKITTNQGIFMKRITKLY